MVTTLQEALPCPFCGKQHTLQVISGQELMDENQEFWQHSESFGVVCDASQPEGKGGCGAMGGFRPTEDEAIEAWNTRTALAQQDESAQVQYLKSELAHALAQHREQQPVCHGCGIPAGDVHMSTCKSGKWPSRVSNGDTAAPAPQPAQGEPTGCACRWDADDNRVATCARHLGWLDVVHEWAERAKAAEAALQSTQPKQEPLTDEAIYSIVLSEFKCVPLPYDIRLTRAIEAAHGITGMVEAATRPAIDVAGKQGGQLE